MVIGVHHVAFAEDSQARALQALREVLGLRLAHEEVAEGFVERMLDAGGCFVQMLAADGDGVVQRFLDRRGSGLHHVAFTVTDIDAAVDELHRSGRRMVDSVPRAGGMGTRIAFIHPEAMGGLLVELVQDPANQAL